MRTKFIAHDGKEFETFTAFYDYEEENFPKKFKGFTENFEETKDSSDLMYLDISTEEKYNSFIDFFEIINCDYDGIYKKGIYYYDQEEDLYYNIDDELAFYLKAKEKLSKKL